MNERVVKRLLDEIDRLEREVGAFERLASENEARLDAAQHEVATLRECRDKWKAQAESLVDQAIEQVRSKVSP